MKKSVLALLALIAILLVILYLKMNGTIPAISPKTAPYSSEDIEALLLKGAETIESQDSFSYEYDNSFVVSKHSYKGNKYRLDILSTKDKENNAFTYAISDLDGYKQYCVDEPTKTILVLKSFPNSRGGHQHNFVSTVEYNNKPNTACKIKYTYIKDGTLEGKDCILIKKERIYRDDDGFYTRHSDREEDNLVYWIEKSTGFELGETSLQAFKENATPLIFIRNISFEPIPDSAFELPTGYKTIEEK